jgi:DNA-binding SARP family transcriptional activator
MRALLAFLLLHANEPLSSDRLIDEVWGPDPPKTAGASLQNYVSRLRKAIGPELIVSQPPGYALRVDPEHFDLARFERLVAEARGAQLPERAEKLRASLALWRGRALEDLAFEPFIRDEAGRLEEARLAALEDRIDADLALGAANELVVELEALVEEHPLRERFRGQLMLALYRSGRQADALEAYREARRVLMDELGLEPSAELRGLQQAILRQDASLSAGEVPAVERPPDRRTVTVLICDLVGSTKLAAELDPEVYRQLISRYFDLVRAPIERHAGTVEKFMGDAVMAVFGVPSLHEDDALRAVRAAEEAQAALAEETWIAPVAARIGVSTGEVHVLSAAGGDLHISGAAASAAARLEEGAPPGGILLSKETHRLVRDAVRATAVGEAWRLDEVLTEAAPYSRRLDASLVGRSDELQRVRNAYETARDRGKCSVVTVVGEAGIGKTRLARELVGALRDEARLVVGRCVAYGEGATYLPIADLVRHAADENTLDGIRRLLEGEDDADAIATRIGALTGVAESSSATGEVFWAVRRLLEALARAGPLLVVLDDIHWAEPTLLDLVEYLGEWADGPIFVLCLARRELLESRPVWGGPTSTGFLVELEPLGAEKLRALVEELAPERIGTEVRERIVERADGNPLFAEQLLAFTADAPDEALENPPPNIEALLASRVDRLDPRDLGVLRRAAVLGRNFTIAQLEDLGADRDTSHFLQGLMERRFVRPARDLFRFHHVLVRDVVYRGIPKAERAELHQLAAHSLDRRDGTDEIVGYHFEQAYRYLTELQRADRHTRVLARAAGEFLARAGIRAWKRADAPAAVNLLTRTLEFAPDRGDLACELALALHVSGDRPRAQELLSSVASRADEHTRLRAGLEGALLRSLAEPDRAGELLDAARSAVPILEEARDDRGAGRAWYCIAFVRGGFYCEYGSMEHAAERAGTCYSRAGWSTAVVAELLGLALYFGPRPVGEAIERLESMTGSRAGDPAAEANLAIWLGPLEAMRGHFDVARAHAERGRRTFRELGLAKASVEYYGRSVAMIELLAGFPDAAERALREACVLLQEMHDSSLLATRAAELASVLYELRRYDEAAVWLDVARKSAGDDDLDAALTRGPVEAKVFARQGHLEKAERVALETVRIAERTDALGRRADALLALAETLALAGSKEEAEDKVNEALALYERKGNVAAAARVRARLPASTVGR